MSYELKQQLKLMLDASKYCSMQERIEKTTEYINNISGILLLCALWGGAELESKYIKHYGDIQTTKKIVCTNLFCLCFKGDGIANQKERDVAQRICDKLDINDNIDNFLRITVSKALDETGEMLIDLGRAINYCTDNDKKQLISSQIEKMIQNIILAMSYLFTADGVISDMDEQTFYSLSIGFLS